MWQRVAPGLYSRVCGFLSWWPKFDKPCVTRRNLGPFLTIKCVRSWSNHGLLIITLDGIFVYNAQCDVVCRVGCESCGTSERAEFQDAALTGDGLQLVAVVADEWSYELRVLALHRNTPPEPWVATRDSREPTFNERMHIPSHVVIHDARSELYVVDCGKIVILGLPDGRWLRCFSCPNSPSCLQIVQLVPDRDELVIRDYQGRGHTLALDGTLARPWFSFVDLVGFWQTHQIVLHNGSVLRRSDATWLGVMAIEYAAWVLPTRSGMFVETDHELRRYGTPTHRLGCW